MLLINEANWRTYLSLSKQQKIDEAVKAINQQIEGKAFPANLKDSVVKQMIIIQVLIEKGGYQIEEDIVLTESLNWTEDIEKN